MKKMKDIGTYLKMVLCAGLRMKIKLSLQSYPKYLEYWLFTGSHLKGT